MMERDKRWITLILLVLGTMIISGCAVSKEAMITYNEAKDTFQKATFVNAKKCAPCQYATAEAFLALADHEISERTNENHSKHFGISVKTVEEKSLEALELTPCEKPHRQRLRHLQRPRHPGTSSPPRATYTTAT